MNLLTLRFSIAWALLVLAALGATSVSAESAAGPVELLAIDPDTTGNTATSIGTVEVCAEMAVGEQHTIDVVIQGVPEATNGAGALLAMDFSLNYDQRYVRVVAVETEAFLLGSDPGSNLIDFTDAVPDDDGQYRIASADFGDNADEAGDGVLARITLEGVDVGTSELRFGTLLELRDTQPDVIGQSGLYDVNEIRNALITVGEEIGCDPNATPPPPPSPTDTPVPTEPGASPGGNGGGQTTPVPTNPDGTTITPGPGDDTPGPGESPDPDDDDGDGNGLDDEDDDDDNAVLIALAAMGVTAVLLGIAGAGYMMLRRRGEAHE